MFRTFPINNRTKYLFSSLFFPVLRLKILKSLFWYNVSFTMELSGGSEALTSMLFVPEMQR